MRHPADYAVCLTPQSHTVSLVETAWPLIPHRRLIILSHRVKEPGGTRTPSCVVTPVPICADVCVLVCFFFYFIIWFDKLIIVIIAT